MIDKFKAAFTNRVDLMLECAYKVAFEGGYDKDKDTFLCAVRDALKDSDGKEDKE